MLLVDQLILGSILFCWWAIIFSNQFIKLEQKTVRTNNFGFLFFRGGLKFYQGQEWGVVVVAGDFLYLFIYHNLFAEREVEIK